jgi:hypothetical protein
MKAEHLDADTASALLRRFEPVLRFTKGERFYPMDVEPYVQACSLWVQHPGEEAIRVVPDGELTLDHIAQQPDDEFGAVHFLKLTDPQSDGELGSHRSWWGLLRKRVTEGEPQETFRAGRGRLARVGYVARIADALYSLTLLARGRVPGQAATAALEIYKRIMDEREHYRYHGRVVRQNGWIVLQYWLFYAFNDWRSAFHGANDHEADWEKVFVYLYESETGEIRPEWAAYSVHEYTGDDLRRRWDDPELETVGEHPVIYVCAGSHASHYAPGEYLIELGLNLPPVLARARNAARAFWRKTLRQYVRDGTRSGTAKASSYFHIPFVDYARGDDLAVGPGQEKEWDPPRLMMNPTPRWVSEYRGLWGLYARDPFEGEDAPAGPRYDRDKSVSKEWYDPVGWAGLDKVPPPTEALGAILDRRAEIETRYDALRAEVKEKSCQLEKLGMEAAAMRHRSHLDVPYEAQTKRIEELSQEVDRLRAQLAADEAVMESLADYADRLRDRDRGPARDHIVRAHQPVSEAELRSGRVAEVWAAVSVGLMVIALVGIFVYEREHLISMLVFGTALFAFLEAGFRGWVVNLVSSLNVGLGVVAGLVILYEFFWRLAVLALLAVGVYVLWENLRELRR